jgi:phenylacetate-CoA ligase
LSEMEFWSFPPTYDRSYMPEPNSKFWFPQRETMEPRLRDEHIVNRLREVMKYAYKTSSFYRNKWDEAGVGAEQIRSLEDFEKVPVVTKKELRESQARTKPFGDYLCIPEEQVHHVHGTSGTTGRPTVFAVGRDDWETIAENQARILWAMGLRPGDMIFIAAIFSLYLGSWGAMLAAERLGAKSFPFGAGAPGMTARAVQWLKTMKPQGFYSTPSYALHLAEVASDEGVDPAEFGLRAMFFSGEPGASIPGIRDRIQDAYGARVFDCGTMAEMTPFMSASGTDGSGNGMVLFQDMVYHEVCDPETSARVSWGERGTPVYTHLERTSQPMIRLASGDLTHWVEGPSECGRTYPILPDGVYGRIDDMFQIRGENIYPSEIDAVLNELAGYGGEHRIIISREGAMDELLVQFDASEEVYEQGDEAVTILRTMASESLRKVLGVRAKTEVVAANFITRTDHKARRVIDDRELFRTLNNKLL